MKTILSITAMVMAAVAGTLWAMPTDAKADKLLVPAFHLECKVNKQCQDV
jgi:hypothetical protein